MIWGIGRNSIRNMIHKAISTHPSPWVTFTVGPNLSFAVRRTANVLLVPTFGRCVPSVACPSSRVWWCSQQCMVHNLPLSASTDLHSSIIIHKSVIYKCLCKLFAKNHEFHLFTSEIGPCKVRVHLRNSENERKNSD